MDKNYLYYNNKGKYNNICIPSRKEVLKYLIKENYLSEFSTDEEKEKVLDNLGINVKLLSILSLINLKSISLKNLLQLLQELYTSIDEKANFSDLNKYVSLAYFLRKIEELKPKDEKSKGYFSSLEDLLLEFPRGEEGDWSIVNVSGTWYVYRWSNLFGWVLAETYDNSIDLSEYAKRSDLNAFLQELISGENIKTINGHSILGRGNIIINGGGGEGSGSSISLDEYYTISEIEELLSQLRVDILSKCNKQGFKIVDIFPTVNINNNLIYLLREDEHSPYKQYVHDDTGWHLLGTLELNLDGYLQESDIKAINGLSLVGSGSINLMSAHGVALTESGDLDSYYVTKEEFYDMLNPYKAAISASPSLSEYTGNPISITINVGGKKGLINVPSTFNVYKNNLLIGTDSSTVDKVTNKGKYIYKVVATSEDGKSASAQTEVNIVLPTYYGFSLETDINNINLTSLTKEIKLNISMNKTLENTISGSYLYIITPLPVNVVATDPGFTYKVKMILIDSIDGLNYYRSNSAIDISYLTYYIK